MNTEGPAEFALCEGGVGSLKKMSLWRKSVAKWASRLRPAAVPQKATPPAEQHPVAHGLSVTAAIRRAEAAQPGVAQVDLGDAVGGHALGTLPSSTGEPEPPTTASSKGMILPNVGASQPQQPPENPTGAEDQEAVRRLTLVLGQDPEEGHANSAIPSRAKPLPTAPMPGGKPEGQRLSLGSYPADPLIAELVKLNPTSVRLHNAIFVAAGHLPLQRLSEYVAAGDKAPDLFMRHVQNLGRKTAAELDDLVRAAKSQLDLEVGATPALDAPDLRTTDEPLGRRSVAELDGLVRAAESELDLEPAATPALDAAELRATVCGFFADLTVREALEQSGAPGRLLHGLEQVGRADDPLSDLLLIFPEVWAALVSVRNVGRASLSFGRQMLGEAFRSRLEATGLTSDAAHNAEALVFDGVQPDGPALRAITQSLRRGAEPGTTASAPTITGCIKSALDQLDQRSSDVIHRRYGFAGPAQTLEEVGGFFGVTRERVRQIEAKALRRMRQYLIRSLRAAMLVHGIELWQALAGNNGYVLARRLLLQRQQLPARLVLALDLCNWRLEQWLDEYAQPVAGGWIQPGWSDVHLATIQARLEERLGPVPLPCALAGVVDGEDASVVRAALELADYEIIGTYITIGRLKRRVQRALRLHAILGAAGEAIEVLDLLTRYKARTLSDPCSARDCEIAMEAHRHLFVEVTEGFWAAIGPSGEMPIDAAGKGAEGEGDAELDYEETLLDDEQTVAQSIAAELRAKGPSRISELVDRAPDFLPPGRSKNSIGPVLITTKDIFARPLPGLYALHDQVPSQSALLAEPPPYLFKEDQVRLYALARRAGEPWGAYPLWLPEAEYLWCIWARKHADTEVLESLLSVAQVDAWPEVGDRDVWRELAETRGRFSMQFPPRPDSVVAPDLDRVLAACIYVRQHGHISWISGNRILMRRAPEHVSAGLLAVLVALGILAPGAEDWQVPHKPGPRLGEQLARLEAERLQTGDLDWDSEVGRELRSEAAASPSGGGWVSDEVVRSLFEPGADGTVRTASSVTPLEQLLSESAELKKSAELEDMLRTLAGSGGAIGL